MALQNKIMQKPRANPQLDTNLPGITAPVPSMPAGKPLNAGKRADMPALER